MKIVKRTEFLSLPSGTFYSKASYGSISDSISVKHDSLNNDWYYYDVGGFNNWDSTSDLMFRIADMIDNGAEYPAHTDHNEVTISRDGMFDLEDECYFAIYSDNDIELIKQQLR